ncbi:MAG: flagellar FlbD family protein [Eubacteriaceae bacterium]
MIILTSLKGKEFYLNSELIYKIDKESDTIITLQDGMKIRVSDNPQEIIDKIIEYKRRIYLGVSEVD